MKKEGLSVGIIMDGNRRWAKKHGMPSLEGHRKGAETLEHITQSLEDLGIKHLIVYAFSTENWKRAPEEVSYLMDLFRTQVIQFLQKLTAENNLKVIFVGQRERFSQDMQDAMADIEKKNPTSPRATLSIALSYGGRAEILHAVNELVAKGEPVTEEIFKEALWTSALPDPDIIIRTGGERRFSGFLPWQSVYSELFFVDTLWPDFSREELSRIIGEFHTRDRRHGT